MFSAEEHACLSSTRPGFRLTHYIGFCWILCSTRMVLSASTLARGVSVTGGHTLVTILGADEVWESERVFRGIRRGSTTADAAVCQSILFPVSICPPFFGSTSIVRYHKCSLRSWMRNLEVGGREGDMSWSGSGTSCLNFMLEHKICDQKTGTNSLLCRKRSLGRFGIRSGTAH